MLGGTGRCNRFTLKGRRGGLLFQEGLQLLKFVLLLEDLTLDLVAGELVT